MLPLNRKRLLEQFLDWKITLMLHWGSALLKELYNLDLEFKENWPKNVSKKLSKGELYYLLKLATFESSLILITFCINKLMASPLACFLGPTLANAFLFHYEKIWLDRCPPEFKPVVYRRYVDDIFVC